MINGLKSTFCAKGVSKRAFGPSDSRAIYARQDLEIAVDAACLFAFGTPEAFQSPVNTHVLVVY